MMCPPEPAKRVTSRQDERDLILKTAWEVLEIAGYESLKIRLVLRRSGLSTHAFYRHFKTKDDLLVALLQQELSRALSLLTELTADGTPLERVRAWVDAVVSLAYGRNAGPRAKMITLLTATLPEHLRQSFLEASPDRYSASVPLQAAIEDGVASGDFRSVDPARDAQLILALCNRITEGRPAWLPLDRAEGVAVIVDFAVRGLQGPSAVT